MSTYHCSDGRLKPNFPHSITERDKEGVIVAAYTGYWQPNRGVIMLYPDYRHPAIKYKSLELRKKKISDIDVVLSKEGDPLSRQSRQLSTRASRDSGGVKSSTGAAMKDLLGQTKMNF